MTTPPVGLSPFVTSPVAPMPTNNVVNVTLPWPGILFFLLTIIACVPWVSTFLATATMAPKIIIKWHAFGGIQKFPAPVETIDIPKSFDLRGMHAPT